MRHWWLSILVVLAGFLGLAGCERKPAATSGGVRVAVLSPGLAATMSDLGYSRFIVARHAWDLALPPEIPVAGDTVGGGIDYERLIATNPTHVVVQFGSPQAALPERLTALASEKHWTLTRLEPLTLDEVWAAAKELDELMRKAGANPEPPGRFAAVEAEWRASRVRDPSLASAGRVLLLGDLNPPTALGPGSWHDDLLRSMGGTPAIPAGDKPRPWIVMDAEDLRKVSPDAIIYIGPRGKGTPSKPLSAAELKERLIKVAGGVGGPDIPAIDNGRLVHFDDPLAHLPATTVRQLAAEIRTQLEAWRPKTAER